MKIGTDSPQNYLEWHYVHVPIKILRSTFNLSIFFNHFFSITALFKTLFAPWKRQYVRKTKPGLDLNEIFERFTFNLISRVIGAMVRLSLMVMWLILELVIFPISLMIFLTWIILPIVTLPLYLIFKDEIDPVARLAKQKPTWAELVQAMTSSTQGRFVLERLNLSAQSILDLKRPANENKIMADLAQNSRPDTGLAWELAAKNWIELKNFLQDNSYKSSDPVKLANWWQRQNRRLKKTGAILDLENLLAVPPFGSDLAFGYTPTLDQYCLDLGQPLPYSHHLVGRAKTTKQMEQIMSRSSGNNVILVGEPGVGRNTIIEELAKRIKEGKTVPGLAHRKILSFGIRRLLSERKSIAEAKGLIEDVLAEAAYAGNIILVIETFDQFISSNSGRHDLTTIFNQAVRRGVQIIGVSTPDDFARYLYPNQELLKHFKRVDAEPPTIEEAQVILEDTLHFYEKRNKVFVTYAALKEVIQKVDKYVVNIPFPEKAIDLLDETCVWAAQQEIKLITPQHVNKVISIKTKIPLLSTVSGTSSLHLLLR